MPLNQLAIIVITICFYFLLSWVVAVAVIKICGYKLENYSKLDFCIKFNAVLSLVAVSIAVLAYYFKIIN